MTTTQVEGAAAEIRSVATTCPPARMDHSRRHVDLQRVSSALCCG